MLCFPRPGFVSSLIISLSSNLFCIYFSSRVFLVCFIWLIYNNVYIHHSSSLFLYLWYVSFLNPSCIHLSVFMLASIPSLSFAPKQLQHFLTSMTSSERCSIRRGCERDKAGTSLCSFGPQRQDGLQQNISTNRKAPAFVCI